MNIIKYSLIIMLGIYSVVCLIKSACCIIKKKGDYFDVLFMSLSSVVAGGFFIPVLLSF